jgi:hypothetical protein
MAERAIRKNIGLIFRLNNALIKRKNREMGQYDLTSIQADVLMYILNNSQGAKSISLTYSRCSSSLIRRCRAL